MRLHMFQHAAARRRLEIQGVGRIWRDKVSTRSRPKAAGFAAGLRQCLLHGFNTQPPEGGWTASLFYQPLLKGFNTQPPEGGWFDIDPDKTGKSNVSTRSRPKAAGEAVGQYLQW